MPTKNTKPKKASKAPSKGKTKPKKKRTKKPKGAWERPHELSSFTFTSDTGSMQDPGAYYTLIYFIALPQVLREEVFGVSKQIELAEKLGVANKTLSVWKSRSGFKQDVTAIRSTFFRERTAEAILALEKKAIRTGDASEVKLLLEYTGEMKKETEIGKVPELLAEAINTVSKFLDK